MSVRKSLKVKKNYSGSTPEKELDECSPSSAIQLPRATSFVPVITEQQQHNLSQSSFNIADTFTDHMGDSDLIYKSAKGAGSNSTSGNHAKTAPRPHFAVSLSDDSLEGDACLASNSHINVRQDDSSDELKPEELSAEGHSRERPIQIDLEDADENSSSQNGRRGGADVRQTEHEPATVDELPEGHQVDYDRYGYDDAEEPQSLFQGNDV